MTTMPLQSTFAISSGLRPPNRPDHQENDIAAQLGTPIYAPIDAVVDGIETALPPARRAS